jgi:D-glycero-D-manno-heptose 1,7-bisphosphate phosphatase
MPMSQRRFVLLDRDGTVIVRRPYLCDPCEVELLPNAVEGLLRMRQLGLGLVLVTNQSGVGRGLFTIDQMHAVNERLEQLLLEQHVVLDDIFFCPHRPEDGCACRKPLPGMVHQAAAKWGFHPHEGFVIGDAQHDMEMGRAVGAVTIHMTQDASEPDDGIPVVADHYVADLAEAATVIERYVTSGP